jgi:hypothetical protein
MRTVRALVPLLSLAAAGIGMAGPAMAGSQPLCAGAAAMSTGPVQVAATSTSQTVVRGVRVGSHTGCDRVVFEFAGPMPGYSVRYVPTVTRDGSGLPVALSGSAFLEIVLRPTSTTTHAPQSSVTPGYAELRQVTGAGDFEGVTSYGVGLKSKQPFRAYRLASPNRLVIDIAAPAAASGSGTGTGTGTQVSRTPTGGAQAGGGSTAGLEAIGLLATGGALLVAAGTAITARRRALAQA